MSVSKDEFFDILRDCASKEFEHIPKSDDEVDYKFSKKFERKMEKLIDGIENEKKPRRLNLRKAIAAVAAAIIAIFASVMSVSAVREPFVDIIFKIYTGFTDLIFEGDTTDKLTYIYSFSEIPKGFVETARVINDITNYTKYENAEEGKVITLSQDITDGISISIDNDHGHIEKYEINGIEINIYVSDRNDLQIAFWTADSNYIELAYHGTTTVDEMLDLVKLIR